MAILSVTWTLCLTVFGMLVLPKGEYFPLNKYHYAYIILLLFGFRRKRDTQRIGEVEVYANKSSIEQFKFHM